uniref:NADH-ubiquinone oxidoreductase chain 5 n=1 Tax=Paralichthyidae sp. TaxID=3075841 RepID=A0AA96C3Z5_9PLEU|nr:NADH dehydrogenase subunit 5 [Paralichthyidae sp.]
MPSLHLVMPCSLLVMLLILATPLLYTLIPKWRNKDLGPTFILVAIMLAFLTSLVPLTLFIKNNKETVLAGWCLLSLDLLDIKISFKFDSYSITFMPIALFITLSILDFARWYMHSDPQVHRFFKYMLIFLIAMMILVTANNLFLLFIGWEGVGIMSFLLIGWWHARANANAAALQAIIYNRVADVGMIFALAWAASNLDTWELEFILTSAKEMISTPVLLALIIAAVGKSAQFGLHPWLPAAMEGPTPVSALLHSSTMVVAGIYLLIRMSPLLEHNQVALDICLCVGALTTFHMASGALKQNDLKKIVAFSTSSQLGLMMVTIGMNQPQLAFLHICTHAFFKAMLFMTSGVLIHALNDEQDIRKMGGMSRLLPFTTTCIVIGSLAMTGVPFLTGFYSKDVIIETLNTSHLNAWALILTLVATCFTAVYSFRIIYYVTMTRPRTSPLSPINENNHRMVNSIKRLALGSVLAGFVMAHSITLPVTPVMTMSPMHKTAAICVTILGLFLAMDLAWITSQQGKTTPPDRPKHLLPNMLDFFTSTINRIFPALQLNLAHLALHMTDQFWMHKPVTLLVAELATRFAAKISNLQPGQVKIFLTMFVTVIIMTVVISVTAS